MKQYFSILIIFAFVSCASGATKLDPMKEFLSDNGGLTQAELIKAAVKIGKDIIVHFKKNPNANGVALAILHTKNDTSDQISTEVFEDALVKTLLTGKITTLRTEKREDQLKEIKLSLQLGTGLSAANLKSPNYFVKTLISEEMITSSGDKIVKQMLNTELMNVETLAVEFSNNEVYQKKAVTNKGMGW